MRRIAIILTLLLLTAAIIDLPVILASPAPELPNGPYVDELVYTEVEDESKAVRMVDNGELQIYLWPLRKVEDKRFAEESANVKVVKAYSGVWNLFINPVETDPEEVGFNPFSIREVREALNYYIDRDFIARELMGGFAYPQVTMWWVMSPEYGRNYPFIMEYEKKYTYNPEKAKSIIYDALYEAGAEYKDGKWYYKDKEITVKVFIRIEDVRKDIGDYVAGKMEELGFTVERVYGPGAKAWEVVYGGDPTTGEWHLYTEGWATTAISAYEDWIPYYMYTSPWTGTVFEIYRPSPELVELATKLNEGEYKDLEERYEWCERLTDLCLKDSTRLWLVTEASAFVHHKDVGNIVSDLQAGFYGLLTLRSIRYLGEVGGSVKVGQKAMFVSAFNPVGGYKWLYEEVIRQAFSDPYGVYPHPHTGRYMPIRAEFEVETAGPDGVLPVPEDAIIFDPSTRSWVEVGAGVNATSKVIFDLKMGKWHHGEEMSMADILMSIATGFRIANPDDPLYDPASVTPSLETFVKKLKGIELVDEDTVVVYIDYWHPDETFIAAQADVWTGTPWELNALMASAVEAKELAYSDTRAKEWGVEWLDISKGPSLEILKKHYDTLSAENYIPPEISDFVTEDEAKARWKALGDWYDELGHFCVSNGPYYLYQVDTAAKMTVLKAFREYPFKADHWDYLVTPRVPEISISEMPDVVPGVASEFKLKASVAGEPYSKVNVLATIINPLGEAVISKSAELTAPGEFTVKLTEEETSKLTPGTYTLLTLAIGEEAAIPSVTTKSFTVIPEIAYFETMVKDLEMSLSTEIEDLRDEMEETRAQIMEEARAEISKVAGVTEQVSALTGRINALMALSAVAIILSLVAIGLTLLTLRRKSS